MKNKYTFSGHESFPCKSLWLKKGYDFVANKNDFNSPDAVITLGVGKNMVASIRFWLRAFGITDNDVLTGQRRSSVAGLTEDDRQTVDKERQVGDPMQLRTEVLNL